MRILSISFKANKKIIQPNSLEQGRAEFNKLSFSKQAALEAVDCFSREHLFEYPSLCSKQTQLDRYVSYRTIIKEGLKKVLSNRKLAKV